jgi:ParB family chromosome partitioning protein
MSSPSHQKGKFALGKGLGALLPKTEIKNIDSDSANKSELFDYIDINKISINKFNPRKNFDKTSLEELSESIKKHGIIMAITVRKIGDEFELISGERRLRAAKLAGLKKVPALIIKVEQDVKLIEMAIIENVQRVDLNPIELAYSYQRLIEEYHYTQEQVSDRIGKDRTTVTNLIRLLKLPEKVQEDIRIGFLSMGHARALLGLSSKEQIITLENEIINKGFSVRQVERIVKDVQTGKLIFETNQFLQPGKKEKNELNEKLKVFLSKEEDKLRHKFGTKVSIKARTEDSGTIEIDFASKEQFERITEILNKIPIN